MENKKIGGFFFEKKLGKGSFGEVYLTSIEDKNTKKTKKLATKILDQQDIDSDEQLNKYFKNEILVLQRLDHPNIIKFHSLKKMKNSYYFLTTEYCNGGDLEKALEKYKEKFGKPFSEDIVQNLMRQIIDAFKYIHSQKVIHRDIKLENILLNFEKEKDKKEFNLMEATVKICDFGFSCFINDSGKLYSTLGNAINMDPILLKKKKAKSGLKHLAYDQKADIWSLGTTCYEMLIGEYAFDANSIEELAEKVEIGTYSVPTSLSSEVVSFINAMLQYDSQKRLSCEELIKHPFLTKEVKDFHSINLKKVSKNVEGKELQINTRKNKSIWAIFNADDEKKLVSINRKNALKEEDLAKINFEDLMLPSEGIPGNPIDQENQEGQKGNDDNKDKNLDEDKKDN